MAVEEGCRGVPRAGGGGEWKGGTEGAEGGGPLGTTAPRQMAAAGRRGGRARATEGQEARLPQAKAKPGGGVVA